ncbi:SIS domain-containing protein [Thermodesulfobacteriota bacterium]
MTSEWASHLKILINILENLSIRDKGGRVVRHDSAIKQWKELALSIRERDKTIFFIGNGASASMASHFSADIAKNTRIKTNVFTDLSLITAIANDLSFEEVYSEPLSWHLKEKDMLVAISSSGNSPNIVRAVKVAKKLGAVVITLSSMKGDNSIRQLGDLNFYVPAETYGLAETAHAAILHYWMDLVGLSCR